MPKLLQEFYDKWNPVQQQYYKTMMESLASNHIATYSSLRQRSIDNLHRITNVPKPIIHAFVKQIQYDILKRTDTINERLLDESLSEPISLMTSDTALSTSAQSFSTGFESLDKFLFQGLRFGQFIEICGEPTANKFKLISHLLISFGTTYSKENIYLFDVSGMLEPKRLSNPFLNDKESLDVLAHIECHDVFNLRNLSQSLENLAALLLSKSGRSTPFNNEPVLIVIDDLSRLIVGHLEATGKLIQIVQTLCGKLDCCVINMHHISKNDMKPQKRSDYVTSWESIIDLKLYVEQTENGQGSTTSVEILKSREPLLHRKRCDLSL